MSAAVAGTPTAAEMLGALPPGSARARQVSDFAALSELVREAGLMRRRIGYYWARFLALLAVAAALVTAFVLIGDSWWQLVIAVLAAAWSAQAGFLAHDAGHRQVFTSGRLNTWAGIVVANLLAGMSYGWWQTKHNRHHANPNKVGSDPDIGARALAFIPEVAQSRRSPLTRWLVRRQGWLFFPLLTLEAIHLRFAGVRRIVVEGGKHRLVEAAFLAVRLGAGLALVLTVLSPVKAVVFILVSEALLGLWLGSAFAPNHKGMPIVPPDVKLDFLRRQVLMSRNISGGRWVDFALGGLNYQVEHHLFPSLARPHLRRVRPIVRAFCAERGVTYTETDLWSSFRIVVRYLNDVGLGKADPFLCPLVVEYRR